MAGPTASDRSWIPICYAPPSRHQRGVGFGDSTQPRGVDEMTSNMGSRRRNACVAGGGAAREDTLSLPSTIMSLTLDMGRQLPTLFSGYPDPGQEASDGVNMETCLDRDRVDYIAWRLAEHFALGVLWRPFSLLCPIGEAGHDAEEVQGGRQCVRQTEEQAPCPTGWSRGEGVVERRCHRCWQRCLSATPLRACKRM